MCGCINSVVTLASFKMDEKMCVVVSFVNNDKMTKVGFRSWIKVKTPTKTKDFSNSSPVCMVWPVEKINPNTPLTVHGVGPTSRLLREPGITTSKFMVNILDEGGRLIFSIFMIIINEICRTIIIK